MGRQRHLGGGGRAQSPFDRPARGTWIPADHPAEKRRDDSRRSFRRVRLPPVARSAIVPIPHVAGAARGKISSHWDVSWCTLPSLANPRHEGHPMTAIHLPHLRAAAAPLTALLIAANTTAAPAPPVAARIPHPTTLHGDTRPDDY